MSVAGQNQPLTVRVDSFRPYNCTTQQPWAIFTTASGGVPPYQYSWSTGDTTDDISGPASLQNTAVLTVTDSVGNSVVKFCSTPNSLLVMSGKHGVGCHNYALAIITGGTPPYTIQWGAYPVYTSSGFIGSDSSKWRSDEIKAFPAGPVTIQVTDATGCTATSFFTMIVPSPPVITAKLTHNTCPDQQNGSIDIQASGGTPPYLYTVSGPSTYIVNSSNSLIENLLSGTYSISVSDNSNCLSAHSATIISLNPKPLATFTPLSLNGSVFSFTPVNPMPGIYHWDFGDTASGSANTSVLQQPAHAFTQAQTYETRLKMTSIFGCVDSSKQNLTVNASVRGRVFKSGVPSVPADHARVWLLRQSAPGGPFAIVDSQDISKSNPVFVFPIHFPYQDSLIFYAALLPQDPGYSQWESTYYGNTPLLTTATRVQTTSLTSLADIFLPATTLVQPDVTLSAVLTPNPFGNTLTVLLQAPLPTWTATLFAADGRQVLEQPCEGESAFLHLQHLPAGVYLLRVNGGGKTATFQIVKI